jgi:type VI secretion system secreted protein Hcp
MPIYMKYDKIVGDATEEGHKEWIALQSFQFGVGRGISSPTGAARNRESSAPSVSEITVTKEQDTSTVALLTEAYQGHGKDVTIDFTSTEAGKLRTYMSFKLTHTMVSGFSMSSGGSRPSESLSLNFTKIETKTTEYKEDNTIAKQVSLIYDIATAKTG